MRIVTNLPRSRRALLAAGGAAVVGCASVGLPSLGVVSAEPDPAPALAVYAPDKLVDARFDSGGLVDAKFAAADLKQQYDKFINTLAAQAGRLRGQAAAGA